MSIDEVIADALRNKKKFTKLDAAQANYTDAQMRVMGEEALFHDAMTRDQVRDTKTEAPRQVSRPSLADVPKMVPVVTEKVSVPEVVLAQGLSPEGQPEMLVRRTDGSVVMLQVRQAQVRNTPTGPRMVKSVHPQICPLVARCAPSTLQQAVARANQWKVTPALVFFSGPQGVFSRELQLL